MNYLCGFKHHLMPGKYIFKNLFTLFFILLYTSSPISAQDRTVKELRERATKTIKVPKMDSGKLWKRGGIFNLNIGQGSQKNWSAGGDEFSFSVNSYLGLHAYYIKGKQSWDNTLDLNYGLVNTSSQGTRKNDDRIDILSKMGYEFMSRLSVSGLVNFHTQFSKGYNYKKETPELLSNFMAPGYLLFSFGMDYKPVEGLSIFISPITSRWVFVHDDSLSAKGSYGVDTGRTYRSEIGAFSSIKYLKELSKNVTYNGRLDLFSNYRHNPQNIDISMNNKLNAKFSKVLSANVGLDLIYDDDVKLFGKDDDSPAWQIKSMVGVGLSLTL